MEEVGAGRTKQDYAILVSASLAVLCGFIWYAVTRAFVWDEGFHLLAARLIYEGKIPYRDFCFPQTPLNAYWNALLIAVFGAHWQPAHIAAAVFAVGGIFLAADLVLRRIPEGPGRVPAATFAVAVSASVYTLLEFAPVGQAYGICMAFLMASYRFALGRERNAFVFSSGLCIGIAAASSLLVAAAIPVLGGWMLLGDARGRWKRLALFSAGVALPFAPVVVLFRIAPRQTLFNIVRYHASDRGANWNGTARHGLAILLDLGNSPAALALLVFAAVGLWRKGRFSALRAPSILGVAIAAAIALELSTAHPTFSRYFILAVPLLAVPASAGFAGAIERLAMRPWLALAGASAIFALSLGDHLYTDRADMKWADLEPVAAKVTEVAAPGAPVYADELVLFLAGLPVADGLEFAYGHRLRFSYSDEALYHVISIPHLDEEIRAGRFSTLETCDEEDEERVHLSTLYRHRTEIGECKVYWDFR